MSRVPADADVAVIGAGIVGLAATDALLRRGARVACLDGGAPGHAQSAGIARGFRHLHTDPALTELAVESRAAWRALEERAGVELLERGGMVRLGGEVEPDIAALRAVGVAARTIDADEAAARLPPLAAGAGPLLLDPDAGAVRARDAVRALARLAGDSVARARVQAVEPAVAGVRVRTSAGDVHAARCLVCAGAGTERLLAPLGIAIARERRAALRLTFRLNEPASGPMPVWGDRSGRFGERAYGTPEGLDRYAVGLIATTPPLDAPGAETLPGGAVDVGDARRRLIAYVRAAFPGLDPRPVDVVLRLIAPLRGPDEDAIGLWRSGGVLAFAGHNLFKHAPRLGELLADATLSDAPPDPRLRPPAA